MIPTPSLELTAILPLLFLGVGSLAVLLLELWLSARRTSKTRAGTALVGLSSFTLLLVVIVSAQAFSVGDAQTFNAAHPLVRLDPFANWTTLLVALTTLFACMLSNGYLQERGLHHGEYYALLLLSASGMCLLVASVDLLSAFLGIELLSIPLYVLAGFDRKNLRGNEAGLKYFLLGAFASAILLYGMALIYGATGSTHYAEIGAALASGSSPASLAPLTEIGVGLVLVGFTFKISSVPFHQWTPDVYEGAPTSVTAFMAVTVKIAAFAALLRLVTEAFASVENLSILLSALAAVTMIVGNMMAVIQTRVKRMLAYSSVAHAGYLLVPLAAGGSDGHAALVFYLAVYSFATLGVFAGIVSLAHRGQEADRFEDFDGLSKTRPGLSALMVVFLLSLAGIPGTAGFLGKFQVFMSAVGAEMPWLAILMALTSVISLFYYLRLPIAMYMRPAHESGHRPRSDFLELGVLAACIAMVVLLGLAPNTFPWMKALDWTRVSVAALGP